jgi:hypothetical protein
MNGPLPELNQDSLAVIAVLVQKLGGKVNIVQADFDAINKKHLHEDLVKGVLTYSVKEYAGKPN